MTKKSAANSGIVALGKIGFGAACVFSGVKDVKALIDELNAVPDVEEAVTEEELVDPEA